MLISKKSTIIVNSSNLKYYQQFFKEDIKVKDQIEVEIENLTSGSRAKIIVRCDNCRLEKELMFKDYKKYGYLNGEYLCRKCKLKKNNLEKFGVENVFQLESVKEKTKKTNLEKFGVEFISQSNEIQEKIKKNNLEKFGVEHHLQNPEFLEKQKRTNLEKWGVDNVSKLQEVKDKKSETFLKKYGVTNNLQSEIVRNKIKTNYIETIGVDCNLRLEEYKERIRETNIKKYGFDNPSKNESVKLKIKNSVTETLHKIILENKKDFISIDSDNKIFKIKCSDCLNDFEIPYSIFYSRKRGNTCICTICNPIDNHQSGKEIRLFNFIKSIYKGEIIQNFRIERQEIDIYIPQLNLGFEFNGVYWHSDIYKDKNFHSKKSKFFEERGIHIFHIWEDDFDEKEEIIKSQIQNLLGISQKIGARKCEVKEVKDISLIKDFLNENHIQGWVNSSVKIGLFFNSELVSLMTFDKFEGRKKMKEDEWNLNRFCNKSGFSVIGGASKLLNFFIETYNPKRIISYSDKDWSRGNLYEILGFKKVNESNPDYKYLVDFKRVHKSNFKKSITGISESNLELPKIWDCGKIKYVKLYN